jgi:ribonuclease G
MSKELIVSVNGREKKIAIIENDAVTEFYIERGEEHEGIVGNIYKGRVMRVLPGMQSAFVDIGLERDAFLYVSDFFDEEEEFERIVIDKTKKGDAAGAEKAAAEHIEKARIEREHRIESTHERVDPLQESDVTLVGETVEPIEAEEAMAGAAPEDSEADAEARRGKRKRKRGKGRDETPAASMSKPTYELEEVVTPFVAGGDEFERVEDPDDQAAEDGAMFKDARVQERIFDQIHAVEFDLEDVGEVQVGSLLTSELGGAGSFQRIDDPDDYAEAPSAPRSAPEPIVAHVAGFDDDTDDITKPVAAFERISDDAEAEEAPKPKTTKKPSKAKAAEDEELPSKGKKRHTKKVVAKRTVKKIAEKKTTRKKKGAEAETADTAAEDQLDSAGHEPAIVEVSDPETSWSEFAPADTENEAETETTEDDETAEVIEDTDAVVEDEPWRAEFATRRGGRRRRGGKNGKTKDGEEETTGDEDDAAGPEAEEPEEEVAEVVAAPEPEAPRRPNPRDRGERSDRNERGDRGGRSSGPRPREGGREGNREGSREGGREGSREGGREGSREGGREGSRDSRPQRGPAGRGRDRDRQTPTITDLLREGQEIMVQIAKEPIARKGARITSHIALPGRFLVYMPTVEHVGVSRKIESDSERQRLRKLIQKIRAEEDVPSGGFIVRTAGVGISEQDLRDDARYLVRLWLDIRKGAEKTKAPAMVHQDLDLVERLLRDQLSDDFAAIRVDSEDEYQRIVEFINLIQPRMVNRVKLYTRDAPILEAFGVQAEIDKAIKPRVWLRSGGYLVINQTEALVAIDVNTGKFVGRGATRLEDTITRTNLEAVDEIVRQIRLRDLGGIIVLDLIDMEDRRNRQRVMGALQDALQHDKSPTKVLSFNDFGLVIMTRKRVKQSLERTLCSPCNYCQGAGLVKSEQTVAYEILEEARRLAKGMKGDGVKQATLRVHPEVAKVLRGSERDVLNEIEDYLGAVDIRSDVHLHQELFDFAFI